MPPLTPSSTRAPASGASAMAGLLDGGGDLDRALPVQLALAELLERDRQRLAVGAGVDQGRHELADALTELRVVAVDLPGPPGGEDHQGVLGVDPCEQVVDLRFDHRCCGLLTAWRPAAMVPRRSAVTSSITCRAAVSRSSLTTVAS